MNDRANIKATIEKFYEIISGTKSESRDWLAFRQLFVTDAQFWLLGSSQDTRETVSAIGIDIYIQRLSTALAHADFYEHTTIHEIYTSHNIATAVTSYYAHRTQNSEVPFKQGTCFLHLVKITTGWRICSMIYQDD
jgi:hypothetical protein